MAPDQTTFDLIVVGGGINGAGVACDAAGRGLSVALVEQDDLASATSSASSKLIHGGLRYLEHYEFRLVREALTEREVLLNKAPHIVWPLRFILPHRAEMRPAWMLRLGLFLYDHLGRKTRLPNSRSVNLRSDPVGLPLRPQSRTGFVYYDCWVDDARLVVANAMQAASNGAEILTRHRLLEADRSHGRWRATVSNRMTGATVTLFGHALVNAAGPWVEVLNRDALRFEGRRKVRLIKGSHIVVPRLHDGDQAYILQHDDGRVIFALPYEGAFSLIGTTDLAFEGDPADVAIEPAEIDYLCKAINQYFDVDLGPDDVVSSYAGVRPLYDDAAEDPSTVTRDYVLDIDDEDGNAPLLSIYGGKVTTYRRLAEHVLERLQPYFPEMGPAWTEGTALPGGHIADGAFEPFLAELCQEYAKLDPDYLRRLARRHGSRCREILQDTAEEKDLGSDFGGGLREREVDYLCQHEWAMTADDILWRRTKCGLHTNSGGRLALEKYLTGSDQSRKSEAV